MSASIVCLLTLALLPAIAATPARAVTVNDETTAYTATYLGGPGADMAGGVDIAADGSVVVGGAIPGYNPGAAAAIDLLGGGNGALIRMTSDGTAVQSITRIGSAVTDLEIGATGQIAVAAQGVGPAVLSADGSTVLWSANLPDVQRIAIGSDGTVAALTSNKQLNVYDNTGLLLGSNTFGDTLVGDVAVHGSSGTVVITGFNNKNTGLEPAQVVFMRGFDTTLNTTKWVDYDWSGPTLRNEQDPNVADSRGYRVSIGRDDKLYFSGESHGGNSTFNFDPQIVDLVLGSDVKITTDAYDNAYNTAAEAKTVYGRYDPATGEIEKIQWLINRLADNKGNTIRGRAVAASETGEIFVAGLAAFGIDDRDDNTINGDPIGPYGGGETFFLHTAVDLQSRIQWTAPTLSGPTTETESGHAIAVRDGTFALLATVSDGGEMLTTDNALQASRDAGTGLYLLVGSTTPQPLDLLFTYGGDYVAADQSLRNTAASTTTLDLDSDGADDSQTEYAFSETTALSPTANYTGPAFYGGFRGQSLNNTSRSFADSEIANASPKDNFNLRYQTTNVGEAGRLHGAVFFDASEFDGVEVVDTLSFNEQSLLRLENVSRFENLGDVRWLVRVETPGGSAFYASQETISVSSGSAILRFNSDGDDGMWALYDPAADINFDQSAVFSSQNFQEVTGLGFVVDKDAYSNSRHWLAFSDFDADLLVSEGVFTWASTAATGTWSDAAAWDAGLKPISTRAAVVANTNGGAQSVSVTSFAAVKSVVVSAAAGSMDLRVNTAVNLVTTEGVDVQAGGQLSGNGTVHGNVTNGGSVAPGASAGVLTVNGDYTQTAGGTLEIELDGTLIDLLVVADQADLAGELSVSLTGGADPARPDPSIGGAGASVDILTAATVTGTFDTLAGLDTPLAEEGWELQVVYNADAVALRAFQYAYGDGDHDGDVDNDDIFLILGAAKFGIGSSSATWTEGDFDNDGDVDNDDVFLILGSGYFGTGPYAAVGAPESVTVPEPAVAVMLSIIGAALATRRRR